MGSYSAGTYVDALGKSTYLGASDFTMETGQAKYPVLLLKPCIHSVAHSGAVT